MCTASFVTLIFIDAPGGTGKTFLINLILSKFRNDDDVIISVASTDITATLMPNGRTTQNTNSSERKGKH